MLDESNRLELTSKDLELIEAALHTQKKILSVQSKAGGTGARQRLSDIKDLMARVSRVNRSETPERAAARNFFAWSFFSSGTPCDRAR